MIGWCSVAGTKIFRLPVTLDRRAVKGLDFSDIEEGYKLIFDYERVLAVNLEGYDSLKKKLLELRDDGFKISEINISSSIKSRLKVLEYTERWTS